MFHFDMLLHQISYVAKNDWNFTPHMAETCQSVGLGWVSLFWMITQLLHKNIVGCTQILLPRDWVIWFCKWWLISCSTREIKKYTNTGAVNSYIIYFLKWRHQIEVCRTTKDQIGLQHTQRLEPFATDSKQVWTICALLPDTKHMECCCSTDGRVIMFIWNPGQNLSQYLSW